MRGVEKRCPLADSIVLNVTLKILNAIAVIPLIVVKFVPFLCALALGPQDGILVESEQFTCF